MGCNTSKESVPQNEEKDEGNQQVDDAASPATEDNTELNETEANDTEAKDTKSASAKTITLRSNGTAKSIEDNRLSSAAAPSAIETADSRLDKGNSATKSKDNSQGDNSRKSASGRCSSSSGAGGGDDDVKEEEAAATKIQAAFRGHQTRKSMKQPAAGSGKVSETAASAPGEPTRQELEQEFRPDDQELCHAATKIQASFRGHMSRKQMDKDPKDDGNSSKPKNEEEELDIDLADPQLNKAAIKIQATFRGHMVRKEGEGEAN